jgi:hypothetical protein
MQTEDRVLSGPGRSNIDMAIFDGWLCQSMYPGFTLLITCFLIPFTGYFGK